MVKGQTGYYPLWGKKIKSTMLGEATIMIDSYINYMLDRFGCLWTHFIHAVLGAMLGYLLFFWWFEHAILIAAINFGAVYFGALLGKITQPAHSRGWAKRPLPVMRPLGFHHKRQLWM